MEFFGPLFAGALCFLFGYSLGQRAIHKKWETDWTEAIAEMQHHLRTLEGRGSLPVSKGPTPDGADPDDPKAVGPSLERSKDE